MNKYTTTDFDLVSFLFCCGINYEEIKQVTPKRAEFSYAESQDLAERVDDFWKGRALVEPRTYSIARKSVKAHFEDTKQNYY